MPSVCAEAVPSNGVRIECPLEEFALGVPRAGAGVVGPMLVGSLSRAVGNDRRLGRCAPTFHQLALGNRHIIEDRTDAVHPLNGRRHWFKVPVVIEKRRQTAPNPFELSLYVGSARCRLLVSAGADTGFARNVVLLQHDTRLKHTLCICRAAAALATVPAGCRRCR